MAGPTSPPAKGRDDRDHQASRGHEENRRGQRILAAIPIRIDSEDEAPQRPHEKPMAKTANVESNAPADHPRERPGAKDSWRRRVGEPVEALDEIANRAGNHRAVQEDGGLVSPCCSRTPCPGASGSILLSELSISQPFIQMPVSGKTLESGLTRRARWQMFSSGKRSAKPVLECPRLARHASTLLRRKLAVAGKESKTIIQPLLSRECATRPPRKLRNLRTRGHGKPAMRKPAI